MEAISDCAKSGAPKRTKASVRPVTTERAELQRPFGLRFLANCRPLPTVDEILKDFIFDDRMGTFHFRKANGERSKFGPGSRGQSGYIRIHLNGKSYAAHRLAWKIMMGRDPEGVIDHINGIRDDNRIENLRDVTVAENSRNIVRGRWQAVLDAREEEARAKREAGERRTLARLIAKYGCPSCGAA